MVIPILKQDAPPWMRTRHQKDPQSLVLPRHWQKQIEERRERSPHRRKQPLKAIEDGDAHEEPKANRSRFPKIKWGPPPKVHFPNVERGFFYGLSEDTPVNWDLHWRARVRSERELMSHALKNQSNPDIMSAVRHDYNRVHTNAASFPSTHSLNPLNQTMPATSFSAHHHNHQQQQHQPPPQQQQPTGRPPTTRPPTTQTPGTASSSHSGEWGGRRRSQFPQMRSLSAMDMPRLPLAALQERGGYA